MTGKLKPRKPIRRFDVFAEFKRLEAEDDGMPRDEAKGYGLWVAKVVAARKFGRTADGARSSEDKWPTTGKWHVLADEPQTDSLFDHEIIERMGPDFYSQVFAPAVREARSSGHTYESIRDRLRRRWKPAS